MNILSLKELTPPARKPPLRSQFSTNMLASPNGHDSISFRPVFVVEIQ